MARKAEYNELPDAAPLSDADIAELLSSDGAAVAGDPARLRNLVMRMKSTIAAHAEQTRGLHREIERLHAKSREKLNPVTAALNALRELSPEELTRVYDANGAAMISRVETARADADRVARAARCDANRLRFVLAGLRGDDTLPREVRERFDAALHALPAEVGVDASPGVAWPPAPAVAPGGFAAQGGAGGELSDALFGNQ